MAARTSTALLPILLRFSDPVLEQRYLRQQSIERPQQDRQLATTHLVIHFFFFFVACRVSGVHLKGRDYLYTVATVVHVVLVYLLRPAIYAKWRITIIVLLRALYEAITLSRTGVWSAATPVTSLPVMLRHVTVTTSICAQIFFCWALSLVFRYNILLHLLANAAYNSTRNGPVCEIILSTPLGARYAHMLWRAVSSCTARLGRISVLLAPIGSPSSRLALHGDHGEECWAALAFLQLSVGLLAPNMILYILERRSRLFFLRSLQASQRRAAAEGMPAVQQQGPATGSPSRPVVVGLWGLGHLYQRPRMQYHQLQYQQQLQAPGQQVEGVRPRLTRLRRAGLCITALAAHIAVWLAQLALLLLMLFVSWELLLLARQLALQGFTLRGSIGGGSSTGGTTTAIT